MSSSRRRQVAEDTSSLASDSETADDHVEDESMVDRLDPDDIVAKRLVRYALACEFSRTPIRRQGLKDKVLGDRSRYFKKIFAKAQEQLREEFGMEMRQLPLRERLTLEEKRRAINAASQSKASETWILVSTLPEEYRTPDIISPSIAPTAGEESKYIGFYTIVVALVALNGGEITDQKLRRYLTRFNAEVQLGEDRTQDVLSTMERTGYVIKKIDKTAFDTTGDDRNISWLVGPRGKEEIGPAGIAEVVREVFGGSSQELEKQLATSLKLKRPRDDGDIDDSHEGRMNDANESFTGGDRGQEPATRRTSRRLGRGTGRDEDE